MQFLCERMRRKNKQFIIFKYKVKHEQKKLRIKTYRNELKRVSFNPFSVCFFHSSFFKSIFFNIHVFIHVFRDAFMLDFYVNKSARSMVSSGSLCIYKYAKIERISNCSFQFMCRNFRHHTWIGNVGKITWGHS